MISDATVISTKQGNLYVAGIIDLYGDMPVGVAMSNKNDGQLVIDALNDMIMRGCGRVLAASYTQTEAALTAPKTTERLYDFYGILWQGINEVCYSTFMSTPQSILFHMLLSQFSYFPLTMTFFHGFVTSCPSFSTNIP